MRLFRQVISYVPASTDTDGKFHRFIQIRLYTYSIFSSLSINYETRCSPDIYKLHVFSNGSFDFTSSHGKLYIRDYSVFLSLSLSLSLSFSCLSVRAVSNRLKIHSGEYLESSTSKRLDIDSFCSTSVNPPFQRTTNRSDLLSFFLLFSFFFLRTHESVSIDCSNRVNESST